MSFNRPASTGTPQSPSVVPDPGNDVQRDETMNLIASDKVEGTDVRRSNGDKIGSIDRLMIDKRSGKVAYAVLGFGGFLGLGESRRPIPWEALKYNEDLDAYEMNIGEDQLHGAPAYHDDDAFDWSDAEWNRNMRSHYAIPDSYRI